MTDEKRWTIGELADATGLTVRTLHHYEEIGLLPATERTASGHRRYTAEDVRRLYQVKALRQLGLPLEQIGGALADDMADWRRLLTRHLDELQQQADQIAKLMNHVRSLLNRLDGDDVPDSQSFLAAIEAMSMFRTHFSQQRRDLLAARREQLGPEAVEAAKQEWKAMVAQIHDHLDRGTPVSDTAVQQLLKNWDTIASRFHGDDPDVKESAARMWRENQAALSERAGLSATEGRDIVTFLREARAYAGGQSGDTPTDPPRPGGRSNT